MKVQKQLSDKRGNKTYYKYVIVLPTDIIEKANFKEGEELDVKVENGEVKIKKKE